MAPCWAPTYFFFSFECKYIDRYYLLLGIVELLQGPMNKLNENTNRKSYFTLKIFEKNDTVLSFRVFCKLALLNK